MSGDSPRHPDNLDHSQRDLYVPESRRPLVIGLFLLPGVVFYEAIAVTVLEEGGGDSLLTSRNLIHTLFEVFGVIGVHLPGVLLLATLLAQHLIARERWSVRLRVLPLMLAESLVWSLPILVLAGVMGYITGLGEPPPVLPAAAIAVGAGLYEEFVFRLVLIAAVHALLVDICGVREPVGRWFAVAASVFAFASYHGIGTGGSIDVAAVVFYSLAGLLLSWLFLTRGLGIAAGAHAVYDLLLLVVVPAVASPLQA